MKNRIMKKGHFTQRLNNKGFSLVELIIVIAIMAILVGVVGTQIIPYLERSRRAKDFQIFSGWNTAGMSAYSMNADKLSANDEYSILITDSSVVCEDDSLDGSDELVSTFCDLTGLSESGTNMIQSQMVSKSGKDIKSVRIEIPAYGVSYAPIVTRIYTNVDGTGASDAFDVIENR